MNNPFCSITPFLKNPYGSVLQQSETEPPPYIPNNTQPLELEVKEQNDLKHKRAIQFLADYSGCGYWRLVWPEHLLNANQDVVVQSGVTMILDPRYYQHVKSVRIQRQASKNQFEFAKFLKKASEEFGFHLIYEIDDLIFHEDIPDYNKFKSAFVRPEIRETAIEIMNLCDEMTVTCDFMRDYYASKTSQKNITVIPNYPPRWWIGNFYDERKIAQKFEKNRQQPRILYPGSGAHFDVDCRVKQHDDFFHVNDAVIKSRKKYKWVFFGGFPLAVKPYIQSGEMEYRPWKTLYEYPRFIDSLNVNAFVAPLQNNTFNKAKSDLKYVEASCFGLPIACQDLCTYQNAPFKFTTGDEMIDCLNTIFKSKDDYMKYSRKARAFAETRFLENETNIGKYKELFLYKKGSPGRVLLK